ncbi:MAG: hypothetical protein K0S80_5323, partial [Neobacillus sp.]|nr:hypothetical protein [Neobacillus sp.]
PNRAEVKLAWTIDAFVPKNFIISGNDERYISTVNGPNAQKTANKSANLT